MKFEKWLTELNKELSEKDFSLIKKSGEILLNNVCGGEEYPWFPYRCIKPFSYGKNSKASAGIWNWDSAFHAIGVMKWDTELAKEQILGFVRYQLDDGMFIDTISDNGKICDISSKPPVLSYAANEIYKADKDIEFLKNLYPRLSKNLEFWEKHRFYKGLFHYGANISKVPFNEFDLYVRYESGWDNSVRWQSPCSDYWPIDLNCFAVMTYRSMAEIAQALSKTEDYEKYKKAEKTLIRNINSLLWNDELKCYTDVNRFDGKPSEVLSPASFMPLFIEIASDDRAACLARYAGDKNKFFPGMPTVSYDNKEYSQDYWRGNTWLNVAYFAAKGLKNYGFDDTADAIKATILDWVYSDSDCVHENYEAKTGKGLYCPYFSWSCVFVMEFILDW